MNVTPSFEGRAKKLKTRNAARAAQEKETRTAVQIGGLSKEQYWKQHVKTKADAVKYYELFYPEYPDILVSAIVGRIDSVVAKAQSGQKLDENEMKLFTQPKQSQYWDYKEEIRQQEMAAKIKVAMERLDLLGAQAE